MDAGLAEKIKTLLSDPAAAEKIAAVAQTLGARQPASAESSSPPAETTAPPAEQPRQGSLPASVSQSRPTQLISALRPLIREEKRKKLDALERAMTLATLFSGMRKG